MSTPPTPATDAPAFNDHGCIYCRAQGSDCEGPHKFATEEREAVARAYQAGAEAVHKAWVDTGGNCPGEPDFWEAAHDYADAHPFVAAEILAAEEREAVAQWCSGCHEVRSVDCYRAGCPKSDTERRAAEILAAEANERARIAAYLNMRADQWRDLAVAHSGDALKWADCSARENELLRQSIAIERNEHGAGK